MTSRAVRNKNPGNLRPRRSPPQWPNMAGIDGTLADGYAQFYSTAQGFCALGLWCLDARYLRGLTTAEQLIGVYAPPEDRNPTSAYAHFVAQRLGEGVLDVESPAVLEALVKAIAHFEDHEAAWDLDDIDEGMVLCRIYWPAFRSDRIRAGARPAQPSAPSPPSEADALNTAELKRIRRDGGETA